MLHPLDEHYRSVSDKLLAFEALFDQSELGRNYRSHFREFLEDQ